MRFSPAFLDEVRDRLPISAVVGTRVSWDRKKTNAARGDYWACCPFHGEKSPSFHAEDRKGRYHCFGCGVSGDHFRFLVELDGMPFPEAVERVAEMAGVPLPARDPEADKRDREKASLTDVMDMAARFFEERLQGPEGAKARAYLRDRGLSSVTQQQFRLGYAPDSRNGLKEHLAAKGADKAQIEACGLVVHGEDIPVSYDRFRDRIMFPIEDTRGKVIAFGGRALSKDAPAKYLNSPETELFHKGNVLYNAGPARKAAQKSNQIIAVEGYMDVIALAQAGFAHTVAPLGTALTENQLELLWRIHGEPVLCFDGDQAGIKAAWRAADLALPSVQPGRSVRFALLPGGQDPDDLVKASGPEAFAKVLAEARPLSDLIWMRETQGGVFDTPERRAELEKRLRDLTGIIRDEATRRHYAQDMRERSQSFFGPRNEPRGKGQADRQGGGRPGAAQGRLAVSQNLSRSAMVQNSGGAMPLREAALAVTLFNHPQIAEDLFDQIEALDMQHAGTRRLMALLVDEIAHHRAGSREALIAALASNGLDGDFEQAAALARRARLWPCLEDAAIDDAREAFVQALGLHQHAGTLHKELRSAEMLLATDPTEENYQHLIDIQRQFQDAQKTEALIDGFGVLSGRAKGGNGPK